MDCFTDEKNVLDWQRIIHMLKIGIIASVTVLIGDIILGWGISDPTAVEIPAVLSRYLSVSDGRIFASSLLGLIGIPIECLCWFAIYRMIFPYSEKDAHSFRTGIIGCLIFGGCGVHVPCCMAVYLFKRFYENDSTAVSQEMLYWSCLFILPSMILFLFFFFMAAIVQIKAFFQGHMPLPKRSCVFSILFGILWLVVMRLFGDHALTNALSTGWISVGNLWMMCGLLAETKRVSKDVFGIPVPLR